MHIEEFREYCLAKPGVTEETPFGVDTLVFKVGGRIFALTNINTFESINLKCDPEVAVQLREQYEAVQPGYHMDKKHWNTIRVHNNIPDLVLKQWIDQSYYLVYAKLTRAQKLAITLHDEPPLDTPA
ncbi:MmcQ/YjbR family DNA-binding protein [Adhaeribacter rhizoryzae]|uniref:MmcQ/YjbR family DNA-binding protein n=1 Tax=Adhaeribacter rhizoryzae TaxID=2607907 RepID=A0A5M6DR74_9BACT|nr:MmcQ/YjbR family DNA-binding protein [Adhaeribacter rhizoryzae]KAA5547915.1 MmcQ/YjbR family DNA-binding protein [Adhaeribacter rhizoryzae]